MYEMSLYNTIACTINIYNEKFKIIKFNSDSTLYTIDIYINNLSIYQVNKYINKDIETGDYIYLPWEQLCKSFSIVWITAILVLWTKSFSERISCNSTLFLAFLSLFLTSTCISFFVWWKIMKTSKTKK